jgi:hypothetical protein
LLGQNFRRDEGIGCRGRVAKRIGTVASEGDVVGSLTVRWQYQVPTPSTVGSLGGTPHAVAALTHSDHAGEVAVAYLLWG